MNTGIQDAHNLIWKIAMALRSENSDFSKFTERLLASYEDERRPVARLNANISVQNFEKILLIPCALGLDLNTANLLSRWMDRIPALSALKHVCFHAAMQIGLKQIDWLRSDHFIGRHRRSAVRTVFENAKHQTLQLLFPGQDLGFVYEKCWLGGKVKSG
jgi:2-polyprenyl-6-methoxyphenol hydroxylase-like FAD-dependent oxidoreductase